MVLPPCTQPPTTYPNGTVGVFYSGSPSAFDGDCGVGHNGTIPPGLTDSGTGDGIISGVPTTAGVYSFNVRCFEGFVGFPCTNKSTEPLPGTPTSITINAATVPIWSGGSSSKNFSPPLAEVGQTVILHVRNVTGATAVTFNGNAATFTVIDDYTISAVVPSGGGGVVCVTTPDGTTCSPTNFTISPHYAPQITSLVDG